MDKDAYYFPHFSNARHDRKLKRAMKELGIEGYAIYFMLLETLRDQPKFNFPMDDLDLLADEFGTSEQKIRTVICNYKLFQVDEEKNFFSVKFLEYLKPYLDTKHRNKVSGIKGNLIKYGYATKEELSKLSDNEIIELNSNKDLLLLGGDSGGDSGGDRKERKEKKKKEKESKIKYAENVSMLEKEYKTLIDKHGDSLTQKMIEVLDNYKGANGKNYKSDYRAILSWVVDKVMQETKKSTNSQYGEPEVF